MTGPPLRPTGPPTGAVPHQPYPNRPGRGRTALVVLLCVIGIALLTVGAILLIKQQNQDRPSPSGTPGQTGAPNRPAGNNPGPDPGAQIPSSGSPTRLHRTTANPYAGSLHLTGAHHPSGNPALGAARVFGAARAHQNDDNLRTQ